MMRRAVFPPLSGLLSCLLAAPFAWGQEPPKPSADNLEAELMQLLNTPVSGASKREQKLMDSPQAIEVLTGDDLRRMGIFRLQDALKLMTGVDILEPDNGYSVVGMRGVMQQGQPRTVQVLLDGVPLYSPYASSVDINNLPVTLDLIDRIEVVRGPSSTLYGANAVVGVISITTRRATDSLKGDVQLARADKQTSRWDASLVWGGGDWGVSAGYGGASLGNSGRTAYYLGDQAHAFPVRLDSPEQPNASHQMSAFARCDWNHADAHLWASAGTASKQLGQTQGLLRRWYDLETLSMGWHQTWNATLATEIRLSRIGHTLNYHMDDADATSYQQSLQLMQYPGTSIVGDYRFGDDATTQVEIQANWDPGRALHFVMGADTRRVKAKKAEFLGLRADDTESASGAFLSMDWTFAPDWTLSLGARAENETLGGSRTSPRATLVWALTPSSVLRAGFYTATRSPQLMEQKVDYVFPYANPQDPGAQGPLYLIACQILPNEQLQPEKTSNYEVGYRQMVGPVTMDLTCYWMEIKNQISQVLTRVDTKLIYIPVSVQPPAYVTENVPVYVNQFQNRGDATNKGLELAITWAIRRDWSAGFNGRYLDYSQDDDANGPADLHGQFSYAPKHVATAWTRFALGRFSGYLDIQHIASTAVEALKATGVSTLDDRPAYVQCDAQVQFEVIPHGFLGVYARNAARPDTLQGATGPDRPPVYQTQRRELGATFIYRF